MNRLLRPLDLILLALHAYIGLRLLAPFDTAWQVAGAAALAGLFGLMPRSWWIREASSVWRVMVPWIATGFFSWLLVLTIARDLVLLAAFAAFPAGIPQLGRASALADRPSGARIASIYGLVGAINLPIIHYSVVWWNTLHQGATISMTAAPKMAETMLTAMLLMAFAAWAYTIAVALHRVRSIMIEREALSDWVGTLRGSER